MSVKINYDLCCWRDGSCQITKSKCSCLCGTGESTCGGCVTSCPTEAITRTDKVYINEDLCTECGACVDICPNHAIYL